MTTKFNRNYVLLLSTSEEQRLDIRVTPPFTLEFEIVRALFPSTNVSRIRIYNLSEYKRGLLRYNLSNIFTYRPLVLRAGYGSDLTDIFRGNVSQAFSYRQGVDWITQIECHDGGYAMMNGETAINYPAGTPTTTAIAGVMKDLPHVKIGAIGGFNEPLTRATTFSGNTADILTNELTNNNFFIDKERAFCLKNDEVLFTPGEKAFVINSQSGLLGTPILEQSIARFDMMFEPWLNVGMSVLMDSSTGVNYNGVYRVNEVCHSGIISGSMGGEVITSATFTFDRHFNGVRFT